MICYCDHSFSITDVSCAVTKLKHNKSDGRLGHSTDHIIYGTNKLCLYLSLLFTGMLRHGYIPNSMLISTMVPIPKNKKKSLNNSENYRAISLSSILGKLLDLIILSKNSSVFNTSDYQFGFKKDHSTSLCTFVVNEVIQYYLNNSSDVFVMFLDASKAFDRVQYVKLFGLLRKKGLCPVLIKLLLFLYTKQMLCVKWGNCISDYCTVSNGVKQGGVLSPILFTVYFDELFEKLKLCGTGCFVGNKYMGSFGYADDCVLLSPTVSSLRHQLEVCDRFSTEFNVLFNPDKYQLLHCSNHPKQHLGIEYNGCFIKTCKSAMHLGNVLTSGNVTNASIDMSCANFCVAVNSVLSLFPKAHSNVKYYLFHQFCMSLYGCVLWDLSSKYIETFYVKWRKAIRQLMRIPYTTHCRYLHLLCDTAPIKSQLLKQ